MKFFNRVLTVIGGLGVLFFAYCAIVSNPSNSGGLAAVSIPFAVMFLAGYLGGLIRKR